MIVDPAVLPGLLLLAAELAVLAAIGYVVVRVALRQDNELSALAQGLVVGPALWGIVVNFVMYVVPGLAGAAVGWILMLGLAGVLTWRAPDRLRISARTLAGFAGAVLALSWVALASRQLVGIANPYTDLGLAATIRAGVFPVALPWHPDTPAAYHQYHYGASLLVGLLTPPAGPDLAFVWEIVGVYCWVGFAFVVGTAVRSRGTWLGTLALAPLVLSHGLHTFHWSNPDSVAAILSLPLPAGLPEAGLRTTLADVYWPPVEPAGSRLSALPDVWKPAFPFGYALVFVIVERAVRDSRPTWISALTLAGLVGFLGILVTTLAPVVVVLWGGLEALRTVRARRAGPTKLAFLRPSGGGVIVAVLLLVFAGGAFTGVLGGGPGNTGLAWARSLDASHWRLLGAFETRPGSVGLVSIGPLVVALAAATLEWRNRLVLALAAGASLLAVAWLALEYPPVPRDLNRLAGHARSLALVALLLGLSARLAGLRSRSWRCAASVVLVALVVWPTIARPARSLGHALGQGVELANAGSASLAAGEQDGTTKTLRYRLPGISPRLAALVREHTAVRARLLDTSSGTYDPAVLLHSGRPTNWGFGGVTQLSHHAGTEYLDARHYLEPAAFRRLGLSYVYATDAWVAALPAQARRWLADPSLFDLLARDGDEALYRVRSTFLALETSPHPNSFEALRLAVPRATEVYLSPQHMWENQLRLLRVASVLPHARLVGNVNPQQLHLRTLAPWQVEPIGTHVPALVAMPLLHEAWVYPPAGWREVWRNPPTGVALYAPPAAGEGMESVEPSPVHVRVTDMHAEGERLTFTAALDAPEQRQWAGQDWVLGAVDMSPWAIPVLQHDGQLNIEQWFAGQAAAGAGTTTHTYMFDASDSSLHVRGAEGAFARVEASTRTPEAGAWMLALRLTRPSDRGFQEFVLIVPVLRFEVSDDGTVSLVQVYEAARGWRSP